MKTVIVAGGCGLIGRETVHLYRAEGHDVVSVDVGKDADYRIDICRIHEFQNLLDNIGAVDVFINATYPKGFNRHAEAFLIPTRHMAQKMKEQGRGSIVLLASIYGMVSPKPEIYEGTTVEQPTDDYGFLKGGIIQLARHLAGTYAPVRVNCVSPGGVEDGQDKVFQQRYSARVPLGRMARAKEVAAAIKALAGLKYVTGVNLPVDGGLTAL